MFFFSICHIACLNAKLTDVNEENGRDNCPVTLFLEH